MRSLLLEALAGLVLGTLALAGLECWRSGGTGLVDVPPSHVAVLIDYPSGELSVVEGPGYVFHPVNYSIPK